MYFWLLCTDITVCDVNCCPYNKRLAKEYRYSWLNICYFLVFCNSKAKYQKVKIMITTHSKQETLGVVTISMICSTLASL